MTELGKLESTLKVSLCKDSKEMLIPISRAENPKLAAAEIRDQILHIKRELNIK